MFENLVDAIQQSIEQRLSQINTNMPATIVSYDAAKNRAVVQVTIPKGLDENETIPGPQIVEVPVVWPSSGAGKASFTMPLKAGDPVMLAVQQRSIENWLNGSSSVPDDPRQFDLTDSVAIPGCASNGIVADPDDAVFKFDKTQVRITKDNSVTLGNDKGTTTIDKGGTITIQGPSVNIGSGGSGATLLAPGVVTVTNADLVQSRAPTAGSHVANKQYVDSKAGSGGGGTGPPGPQGPQGPPGPTAVSKDANNYVRLGSDSLIFAPLALPLTGGTMQGALTLAADPIASMQPVTLQYYNSHLPAIPSSLPPSGPAGGDLTGTYPNPTLLAVNGNVGTFNNLTVNAKGLVTAASNASYLTGNQTIALSGDITGSGATAITTTLANTAVTPGSYTYAAITVDAKGRITNASSGLPTPAASNVIPLIESGAGAIGTSNAYARADHVHPQYGGGGGASLTVGDTPPTLTNGAMWFDSVSTQLFIGYNDGNSSQWTVAVNQTGFISDSPTDGGLYSRRNSAWSNVVTEPSLQNNTGRNLLHNVGFTVNQRGAPGTTWTTQSYTSDRWLLNLAGGDAVSVSVQGLTDGNRLTIGDESALWALRNVYTGSATANSGNWIQQPIEGVKRLSGKTVTVSFWAVTASGTLPLGVNIVQTFGTGGSPTSPIWNNAQSVNVTATFARYSLTFPIPGTSGMVLGSNGDDTTTVRFYFSAASGTHASLSGNIGVQSGTIRLWGMQLEIGNVATPLAKRDPADELALCQRFYCVIPSLAISGYSDTAGRNLVCNVVYPVTMRATPTISFATASSGGTNAPVGNSVSSASMSFGTSATAAGGAYWNGTVTASADL